MASAENINSVDQDKENEVPNYFVELAKSGRSECRRCESFISKDCLRVGIIIDSPMGIFTRWQHVECTVFHKSITSAILLDGYFELDKKSQEILDDRVEKSLTEMDPDSVKFDPDELVRTVWDVAQEAPNDMLMPLLPFQKEGLGWMVHQEQTKCRGGILADEMGMGKTIQAVSLILANPRPSLSDKNWNKIWDESDLNHEATVGSLPRGGTLVILPTVAIRQWQTEILRFTRDNALKVIVYHGDKRGDDLKALQHADVVLTSYRVIETEYRKATAGTKVTCSICNKKFYPDKLRVHRKYFCGETAVRTEAQSKAQRSAPRPFSSSSSKLSSSKVSISNVSSDEEDEITKQKKMIKSMKSKVEESKSTTNKGKAKATSKTISQPTLVTESSEDEITKQKKMIKKMAEKKTKRSTKSTTATSIPTSTSMTIETKTTGRSSKIKAKAAIKKESMDIDEDISESESDHLTTPHKNEKSILGNSNRKKASSSTTSSQKTTSSRSSNSHQKRQSLKDLEDSDSDTAIVAPKNKVTSSSKTTITKSVPMKTTLKRNTKRLDNFSDIDSDNNNSDDNDFMSPPKRLRRVSAASSNNTPQVDKNIITSSQSSISPSMNKSINKKTKKLPPPAAAAASKGSKRRRRSSTTTTHSKDTDDDPEDDDYEVDTEVISDDDDEVFDNEETEEEEAQMKKRKRSSSVKSNSNHSKKNGKRNKKESDSEEEELKLEIDNNSEDSEVEREISIALKAVSKKPQFISALHKISWFRIILDEAHLVKDRSSSTANAVFNLVSINKWCLTGTPLQNRVGELYSLVRFLRIDPHAYYFCRAKGCKCKSLHYRFTKGKCRDCNHVVMQHFCHFNKHILNPIKRSGYVAEGKKAMLKLKEQVLDEILLRRTKITRADDIQLPPRLVKVRQEKMDEREDDFYQALYTQSQAQFDTYVASGTVLNNYAHIFDILIRLRQAVDHPYLVIHSDSKKAAAFSSMSSSTATTVTVDDIATEEIECCICHDHIDSTEEGGRPSVASCGHVFCQPCLSDLLGAIGTIRQSGEVTTCPECSEPLTISTFPVKSNSGYSLASPSTMSSTSFSKRTSKSFLSKLNLSEFQSSTKLEMLVQELNEMERKDPGAKALVFSQFVNMLDLVEHRLILGGIKSVKLQGCMNLDQRDKVVTSFREDPSVSVMLISLKAGGVALNLTAANYIFLMDPWWNPASEMQAIDRTHRIGQHKPIYATRIIIRDSIEERLLRLQEKKKLVFDGTIGGDSSSMSRLTEQDMKFLFQ